MQDCDMNNISGESLSGQYSLVKNKVTKSHASLWGDQSFANDTVNHYVGLKNGLLPPD